MSFTPSAMPRVPQKKDDNSKKIIILLLALLAVAIGYLVYDKTQSKNTIQQKDETISAVTSAKDSLATEFAKISKRMDSLSSSNVTLQGSLAEKNTEMLKQKASIDELAHRKNLSAEELKKARLMIANLNEKLDGFEAEIKKLKAENKVLDSSNKQLTTDKNQLTTEKKLLIDTLTTTTNQNKVLADKVDVASTLKASNIDVVAMKVKSSGKETVVTKAKNADLLRISCTLDENRITPSGNKSLYVCVFAPDGKASGTEGNFTLRDGSDKPYTNKVDVAYEQGKVSKVSFNWKPGTKFVPGSYKIEIYNNGFKIGEALKDLRKGGLF